MHRRHLQSAQSYAGFCQRPATRSAIAIGAWSIVWRRTSATSTTSLCSSGRKCWADGAVGPSDGATSDGSETTAAALADRSRSAVFARMPQHADGRSTTGEVAPMHVSSTIRSPGPWSLASCSRPSRPTSCSGTWPTALDHDGPRSHGRRIGRHDHGRAYGVASPASRTPARRRRSLAAVCRRHGLHRRQRWKPQRRGQKNKDDGIRNHNDMRADAIAQLELARHRLTKAEDDKARGAAPAEADTATATPRRSG